MLGRREEKANRVAGEIEVAGGESLALPADVLDTGQLKDARDALLERWDKVDILVNAAGGNGVPEATLRDGVGFFELPEEALRQVMDLNFLGTVLPCQVFGAAMLEGAEARWLHREHLFHGRFQNPDQRGRLLGRQGRRRQLHPLARRRARSPIRSGPQGQRHSARLLYGEQNRNLLLDEEGRPSQRGRTIIQHTPRGVSEHPMSWGDLIWLCSRASAFVNGIVVPVDGGFSLQRCVIELLCL